MEKQAILAVSFGTSHLDTLKRNISAIEQEIGRSMPDYTLRRAFTSGVIMNKLRVRDGLEIDNVPQALERLCREGFSRVVVQPTHIINGEEYAKLCAQTRPFEDRISIALGDALLTSVQDYRDMVGCIMKEIPAPAEDEALVFMGHGTAHFANASYALVEYMLRDSGWDRAYVGTVEGYPELDQVVRRIRENPDITRIRLQPMMVVAGDHANNDMAGPEPDSWKNRLEAMGYQVTCCIRGMGEYESIRRLFAAHARAAAGIDKGEETLI